MLLIWLGLASFTIYARVLYASLWIYASVWPCSALVWHLNDLCHCYGVYRDHGSRFHSGFGMIWLWEMGLMSVIRLSSATPFVLCSLFPFVTIVVWLLIWLPCWNLATVDMVGSRARILRSQIWLLPNRLSFNAWFDLASEKRILPRTRPMRRFWSIVNPVHLWLVISMRWLSTWASSFFVSAVWLNWFQPFIDPRSCCFYFSNRYCSVFGNGRVTHRLVCEALLTFTIPRSNSLTLCRWWSVVWLPWLNWHFQTHFVLDIRLGRVFWLSINPSFVSSSGTNNYIDTSVSSLSSDGAFGSTCH